jgi:hypothetical protein
LGLHDGEEAAQNLLPGKWDHGLHVRRHVFNGFRLGIEKKAKQNEEEKNGGDQAYQDVKGQSASQKEGIIALEFSYEGG